MRRRGTWRTRFGFYFAAIGSAFGLGNLWRFPYVVADNGGGAFVLAYVLLVFLVGVPLLIGELILGKYTGQGVIAGLDVLGRDLTPGKRRIVSIAGRFSALVSLVVLAYFAVISGWVLYYFAQFLVAGMTGSDLDPAKILFELRGNGWLQMGLTIVHLLVVSIVVIKGVEEGIERWVGYMIPIFGVLLAVLAYQSMRLDTSADALRFLFYPDFSQLSVSSLGQALGHLCFTLSIGLGSMVTFASYFGDKAYIPIIGFRVAVVDSLLSLFAGLLIFPLVLASNAKNSGPELLFQSVPILFTAVRDGYLYGILFFLCLYLAALGASIGLMEAGVSNLSDLRKVSRFKGTWIAVLVCFTFALLPAFSSSTFSTVRWHNRELLEILDSVLINWALPLAALGVSQIISYRMEDRAQRNEFFREERPPPLRLYRHWNFVYRWVVPVIIVSALLLQAYGLLS